MLKRITAFAVLVFLFPVLALSENIPVVIDLINHHGTEWAFADDAAILEVYFPPVQGADACILRMGDQVMLIDAATPGQHNRVAAALAYLGISHVHTGFNTHPHDDHIGGFDVLYQAATLDELIITFPEDANNTMINTMRAMREQNVPVRRVSDGDLLPFGDVRLEVIQRDLYWFGENDRSAMIRLDYGERSLLLTADVDTDCQNNLLETAPEKLLSDVFKYPHHGVTPAGWNFLEHIGGKFTIITNSRSRVADTRRDATWRGIAQAYTCYGMVRLRTDGHIWVIDQIRLDID